MPDSDQVQRAASMHFQLAWSPIRAATVAVIVLGLIEARAAAIPYSNLVIFGDSLSDVSNIASATGGVYPGPYYYQNRFSNGSVYTEELAAGLGLPSISPSTAGGSDYAYGGAQTSGTGGLNGLFIKDVDEQVAQFLGAHTPDPHALFVVFSGAN